MPDSRPQLRSPALRLRAWALAGIALVLGLAALQGGWPGGEFAALPPLLLAGLLAWIAAWLARQASAMAHIEAETGSLHQRPELGHASRLSIVGELTASIAHEINQPLGAILNNADAAEMLLEHADPPLDEIRRILGDIRRDGLRASDVIRNVRTLVRKRELALQRLDANAVATDVLALLEPEARRRRIPVQGALSPRHAHLRGDHALMVQVLINLVVNAMDAVEALGASDRTPAARTAIVLGVSTTDHGEIEFAVVDAGQGIPTEHLAHLFDSFHTSKTHGMGLGLSIARSIVEAHGGRIRAENNREGGASFRVTLPPCDEPAA